MPSVVHFGRGLSKVFRSIVVKSWNNSTEVFGYMAIFRTVNMEFVTLSLAITSVLGILLRANTNIVPAAHHGLPYPVQDGLLQFYVGGTPTGFNI